MNFRDSTRPQQAELDRFARRHRWDRGRFRSWKVRGFITDALSDSGYPRRKFIAQGGDERQEFASLDELQRWVMSRPRVGS